MNNDFNDTYSKNYLIVRCCRAGGGICKLFEDGRVQSCKADIIHDIVAHKAGSVCFPLGNSRAYLNWVSENVIETRVSLSDEDIRKQRVIL